MVIEEGSAKKVEGGQAYAVVFLKIRHWHPGYWIFYWRVAILFAIEFHIPFHKWFPAVLMRFFMPDKYEGNLK